MTEAKRKISKFDFKSKGAHCALVDAAANQQTALVMKSAKASEEEIKKAVEVNMKMSLLEFLTRYLGLWIDEAEVVAGMMGMAFDDLYEEDDIESFEDMVQRNLDKVQVNKSKESEKFEDTFNNYIEKYHSKTSSSVGDGGSGKSTEDKKSTKEVTNKMTDKTEVTQEALEEQINKAAESIVAKRMEELEKSYEEKVNKATEELQVLKAREDAREKQEYLAKAESFAKYLGEEADKESIAKALKAVEGTEDGKPVMDILKALKDMAEKDEEGIFKEIGQSATQDQPEGQEAKIEAIQKSLMKEEGISEHAAYVKAADQVREESK